jgi:hypothetical protein
MRAWALAIWALCLCGVMVVACGSGLGSTFPGGPDSGLNSLDGASPDGLKLNRDSSGGGGGKCNKLTCEKLGYTCGPTGDGCGGLLECGTCKSPETCGGGGKFSQCGGSGACAPKTCTDLGFDCGPAGNGCGGALDCGSCKSPDSCGGGGKSSVCGSSSKHPDGGLDGGDCVPQTCASQKIGCGPAGDGCGDSLSCGSCTLPDTCGGGGVPSECGHNTTCVPATCTSLGLNCGPAGDGCGGLITSCGTCTGTDICGGGGVPGQCGSVPACTGLCLYQITCDGGGTTELTGQIIAGTQAPYGTPDPVPNVLVYIPNGTVSAFTTGVECTTCGADVSGDPLVQATTDYLGNFTLKNVPIPPGGTVPLVIQLGRWRRTNLTFPVTACASTNIGQIHMPRNKTEGDIPLTAISTGDVDAMECVLLKMGVDQAEFTDPGGTGRIQLYQGNGAIIDSKTPPETTLVPLTISGTQLDLYDQVILPCWGDDPRAGGENVKTVDQQTNIINYTSAGGRMFATHYSYAWLYNVAPFDTAATWIDDISYDTGTGVIQQPSSFADVNTFYAWMNALTSDGSVLGQFAISTERNDFSAIGTNGELWVSITGAAPKVGTDPTSFPVTFTFDTPYSTATPPPAACGRVIFSDFHVTNSGGTYNVTFPNECTTGEMTAQEKSLEYLIWDLAACIPGPPGPVCTPATCVGLGDNCGPVGDGCGGLLECGTCSGCQVCGGGGTPSVCGGACCVPTTCAAQGIECGPAGNGCGDELNCGPCPSGETCGGGGKSGICGAIDSGVCVPLTCVSQGITCGPAGDGCGGLLECGACSSGETCGGGGKSGTCGKPACTPTTCKALGFNCGPAGDGCGGELDCGTCTTGTCGGGGTPGQCGGGSGPK